VIERLYFHIFDSVLLLDEFELIAQVALAGWVINDEAAFLQLGLQLLDILLAVPILHHHQIFNLPVFLLQLYVLSHDDLLQLANPFACLKCLLLLSPSCVIFEIPESFELLAQLLVP
jgi:hypothetical protein